MNHFTAESGKDFLEKYVQREQIRNNIANQIIKKMNLDPKWEGLIKEDLRGVYYTEYFADKTTKLISHLDLENNSLLDKIMSDINNEMCDFPSPKVSQGK